MTKRITSPHEGMKGPIHEAVMCGRVCGVEEARVALSDPGWLFGATLFETIPLYDGIPYLLRQHWARILASAQRLGVPVPLQEKELKSGIQVLAPGREGGHSLARLTVSASGLWALTLRRPHVRREQFTEGLRLALLPAHLNNRSGLWGTVKSGNIWGPILCRDHLRERGTDEGLYVTLQGTLLECTCANVFLVQGQTLITPPLWESILPGITRARVLDLARPLIPSSERSCSLRDLWEADEAFVTGAGAEVTPVCSIEGRLLPAGSPGPWTLKIMKSFAQDVFQHAGASCSIAEYLPGLLDSSVQGSVRVAGDLGSPF